MAVPFPPRSNAALPVAGAGTVPGQPPFGSSPLTQPTPNRGIQGGGAALVAGALKQLEKAIPEVGTDNEAGVALMKALEQLRKHFPADSVSPGMERARQEQFMMQQRQDNPLMSILKMVGQQQGGAGGGGAAAGLPAGANASGGGGGLMPT